MTRPFKPEYAHRLEAPERLRELPPAVVVELLSLKGDEIVVDYGAGTGVYTVPLAVALPHGRVIAVEPLSELIAMLEAKLTSELRPRVEVVQTADNRVPLPDGGADRVLMVNVLHHVAADPGALAEVVRLLRPGGLFVDIDWGAIDRPVGPGPSHVLNDDAARALIAGMGLREVAVHEPATLLRYHRAIVAAKPGEVFLSEGAAHGASLVAHVAQPDHGAGLAAAVERAVAPFGGWTALVRPGERIAVKINLLRAAPPESAVCTHPETLRCVLRGLKAAGAQPFVGDSPGGPGTRGFAMRAYKASGIAAVCAEEQVEAVWVDKHVDTLTAPEARLYRSFPVGRPWLEADGMIQVGILKTHGLMRLTGGTKLTFGCVTGLSKPKLHVQSQRREEFADMLIDLHLALAPRFTIIDGIVAMEGKGPGGGTPRKLGSLFAARDAIALDAALADRTAHRRHEIYVLAVAERRGLIDLKRPYELSGDEIVAEHGFVPAKWDADMTGVGPLLWWNTPRLDRVVRDLITARPRLVDEPACTRCGNCAEICGAEAITLAPTPVFDESKCVRCFCCTEVCPTVAIVEVSPPLAKAFGKIARRRG